MRKSGIAPITLVVVMFMSACGLAPDGSESAGEDGFECRDVCDKKRECQPSLADPAWDECWGQCEEKNRSRRFADCVKNNDCETSFDGIQARCLLDPIKEAKKRVRESR